MTMMLKTALSGTSLTSRTSEHVSQGHPDKACDQIADKIGDAMLNAAREMGAGPESEDHPTAQRFAIEMLLKNRLAFVSGEVRMGRHIAQRVNVDAIVHEIWDEIGYEGEVEVINRLQVQSPELQKSSDNDGAGDQGIMVGYATNETPSRMPTEYAYARDLCQKIQELRPALPWVRADAKTQVTIDEHKRVQRVVIAVQHARHIDGVDGEMQPDAMQRRIHEYMMEHAVRQVLGEHVKEDQVIVNGTGSFMIGGSIGDAGVVGRKIVVDAYGPHVPVGGGAYSGKDPTKVDRSAAYMARHIAKTAVEMQIRGANAVTVHIAYGIGRRQPEMVTAITETGVDISDWVRSRFPDLSPRAIAERLGLWRDAADVKWTYADTAAFGHYGRDMFPWEQIAKVDG
jgi:S-adenosylmethionine synthetase